MVIFGTIVVTTIVWASIVTGIFSFVKMRRRTFNLACFKSNAAKAGAIICAIAGLPGLVLAFIAYGIMCGINEIREADLDPAKFVVPVKETDPNLQVSQVPVAPLPAVKPDAGIPTRPASIAQKPAAKRGRPAKPKVEAPVQTASSAEQPVKTEITI